MKKQELNKIAKVFCEMTLQGKDVKLLRYGTLRVRKRKETVRNLQGKLIKVPEKHTVTFIISRQFKKQLCKSMN